MVCLAVGVLAACGDAKATDGATSAAPTGSTTTAAASAKSAPVPEKSASPPPKEAGSVADLREKAIAIMDALKKGDAKAAGDYCLGKHHDAFVKYLAEKIEQKDMSRAKAFKAWDGKLGEVRVDGDSARVAYGTDEGSIDYLSFRMKDGAWSFDDTPVAQKAAWEKWGKVAP